MIRYGLLLSLLLSFFLWACSSVETNGSAVGNPVVKDSVPTETATQSGRYQPTEMALLMQQLRDSVKVLKKQLVRKEELSTAFLGKLQALHTAEMTKKGLRGPVLEGFTNMFLAHADSVRLASSNTTAHYNNMISACLDCHQEYCPGPMTTISKLKVKE